MLDDDGCWAYVADEDVVYAVGLNGSAVGGAVWLLVSEGRMREGSKRASSGPCCDVCEYDRVDRDRSKPGWDSALG